MREGTGKGEGRREKKRIRGGKRKLGDLSETNKLADKQPETDSNILLDARAQPNSQVLALRLETNQYVSKATCRKTEKENTTLSNSTDFTVSLGTPRM